MSSFSSNGSPTWTLGRLSSARSSNSWLASVRGAADAVAAGRRADEQDHVAGTRGHRPREVLLAHEAERHRVDEAVALVRVVEVDLAADGGDAEAVAVAADAGDRALEQVALPRLVQRAEAQRVQRGDRTRAHREDVADDAADAGRRALVGLDRARVVVALHLEGDGPAVADADDAGVLAGALEHVLPGGREEAQRLLRVLVAAVLAPHERVHVELGRRSARAPGSRRSSRTRPASGRAPRRAWGRHRATGTRAPRASGSSPSDRHVGRRPDCSRRPRPGPPGRRGRRSAFRALARRPPRGALSIAEEARDPVPQRHESRQHLAQRGDVRLVAVLDEPEHHRALLRIGLVQPRRLRRPPGVRAPRRTPAATCVPRSARLRRSRSPLR